MYLQDVFNMITTSINPYKQEKRALENASNEAKTLENVLLQGSITTDTPITIDQALNIPSFSAGLDFIAGIISSLNVNLYKEVNDKTEIIKDDRVYLLNKNTGDTLTPNDFKRAMIRDFLIHGNSYAYINKVGKRIKSINYVKESNVSINNGFDPVFKDYNILVNGKTYKPYQFIRMLRNTEDGSTGKGILSESNDALKLLYNTMNFEKSLVSSGGNKRGFIKSQKKLSDDALTALKNAWNNLYKDNSNVVILNDGLEFQESSSTSTEMQVNENKQSNNAEVSKIIGVPTGLFDGNMTEKEYNSFIKLTILPMLSVFENALNDSLLTESEKKDHYFQFDTKDLLKASIKERFEAYKIAVDTGFSTLNEIRNEENKEDIDGLDVVKMSLGSVIYDINTKDFFTPNMDTVTNLNNKQNNTDSMGGGEKDVKDGIEK